MERINNILNKQISYEYGISDKEIFGKENIFVYKKHDENYFFQNRVNTSIICYRDKIFVRSEDREVLDELENKFKNFPGSWYLEAENIRILNEIIKNYNLLIKNIFPVFTVNKILPIENNLKFKLLDYKEIIKYKKCEKLKFTFSFDDINEFGTIVFDKGKLIGAGGAIKEAKYFYDISVEKFDFDRKYDKLASEILIFLTNKILEEKSEGIPICQTQFSHTKSIRLMINSGYNLAFTEIVIDNK